MENNIIEAKFTVVQERTLDVIATEIRTIEAQVYEAAITGAVKIGVRLQEIKESVGHGKWYDWIEENLGYSKRQAQRFMEISEKYGDENSEYFKAISKTTTSSHLSISKALALLKVPENEVEDFTEKKDISNMKVKELEAEIKKLKEENKASNELKKERNDLEIRLSDVEKEKEKLKTEFQEYKESMPDADPNIDGAISELHTKELADKDAEIEKLKAKIEKAKEKEKTLKAEKEAVESEKESAIETAKAEAREEERTKVQKEAEKVAAETIDKLTKEAEEANKRAEAAENKLALSASEDLVTFKVKTTELQQMVEDIKNSLENISESDSEQSEKMRGAFKKLMQVLYDGI